LFRAIDGVNCVVFSSTIRKNHGVVLDKCYTLVPGCLNEVDIPLFICREWWHAKPDVCLNAISAVQYNNQMLKLSGLDPLDVKVVAGVTMTGTFPTNLKNSVDVGTY
jgi:hypothetical protein